MRSTRNIVVEPKLFLLPLFLRDRLAEFSDIEINLL